MTSRAKERKKKADAFFVFLFNLDLTFLFSHKKPPSTQLPGDAKLSYFDAENTMQEISVDELTRGKRVGELLVLILVFWFFFFVSLFVVPKTLLTLFFFSLCTLEPLFPVIFAVPGEFFFFPSLRE